MTTDGVLAAAFLPTDGYIDPASVTQAIAKGARMRNARICEHTKVTSITVDGRRASTVHTDQGDIACEMVVNAAGMWGMEIGRMAGVRIPAVAVEHQYVLTGPDPRLHAGRAAADADDARPRSARLLQARRARAADRRVRTRHAAVRSRRAYRHRSSGSCWSPNFDRFEQLATLAAQRTPVIEAGRHPHDDQRADPVLRRRRLRDGQGARSSTTTTSPPASCTASPPVEAPAR